ncbi:putative T7SS-secreted protein [Saccharopolyspora sp. 6M]|uniref:putative T7SS-secreted protein n=1 Tax=Saccharopolyspora sp. 6M TaxID=2877237 RepID=UPI001CD73792|nr:EndoU domain-containing protein [Saccharopolyspora sp. 6M]MCA1228888.1 EndoU domain-containing protein [Saccharopolyspora sp. 6M]
MAELGRTSDPSELVPGDPGELRAAARRWHELAETLAATGKGLSGLDVGQWHGAAAEAFTAARTEDSRRWSEAGEALARSAAALSRYADTLEWGQRNAAEAARLWQQGEEQAATELLGRSRQQTRQANNDTALSLETASGPADFETAAAPTASGSKWDELPGDHPDPDEIHRDWKSDNHILDQHAPDSREPNESIYPDGWSDEKITSHAEDIAKNPDARPVEQTDPDGGTSWKVEGTKDGVKSEVIVEEDGRIRTAYPVAGEGVRRNDEDGVPQPITPLDQQRQEEAEQEKEQAEAEKRRAEDEAREAEQGADNAHRDGDEAAEREAEQERQAAERERAAAEQDRAEAEQEHQEAERRHEAAERRREQAEQAHEAEVRERDDGLADGFA